FAKALPCAWFAARSTTSFTSSLIVFPIYRVSHLLDLNGIPQPTQPPFFTQDGTSGRVTRRGEPPVQRVRWQSSAAHGSGVLPHCQPDLRLERPLGRSQSPGGAAPWSDAPSAPQPVQRDGDDDDDPDQDILAGVGDPGVDAAVLEDGHDHAAD